MIKSHHFRKALLFTAVVVIISIVLFVTEVVVATDSNGTYTFNDLEVGDLHGQDNWVETGDEKHFISSNWGYDGSKAVQGHSGTHSHETTASRINNEDFSYLPVPSEDLYVIEFEMQHTYWGSQFGLGYDSNGDGHISDGEIGVALMVRKNGNITTLSTPTGSHEKKSVDSLGETNRYQIVIDRFANGGKGAASVWHKPLNKGTTEWHEVPGLQKINMGFDDLDENSNPSKWNGMRLYTSGSNFRSMFDNFTFREVKLSDRSLTFSNTDVGETDTRTITLDGQYLNGNLTATLIGDYKFADGGTELNNLGKGSTVEIDFEPTDKGVRAGQLTLQGEDMAAPVTVDLTGVGYTYTLEELTDVTFPALVEGYAVKDTKTFTLKRTGNGDLNNINVTLTGENADAFEITPPLNEQLNDATQQTSFTVNAKNDLPGGKYTATVKVSADKMNDVTFTVTQEVIPVYQVTYNPNGADLGDVPEDARLYGEGDTVTVLGNSEALSKSGFNFVGWSEANDASTTIYKPGTTFDIDESNITLYAVWETEINFIANGGSTIDSQSAYFNSKVTEPDEPTYEGYTFGGWYYDMSFTDKWDFASDVVVSKTTLYAKWTAETYTVTFDAGEGSVTPSTQVKRFNEAYGLGKDGKQEKLPTPTRVGYNFAGWNTAMDGTGDEITDDTVVKTANHHTLYAQWEINEYTVNFNSNGSDDTVPSITQNYDSNVKVPGGPSRVGYHFVGWTTSPDGSGTRYNPGDTFKMPADGLTLYSQWEVNKYTVTFESNGGNPIASQEVDYNEKVTKPTDPTKTGYTFAGWYKDNNFVNKWEFSTDTVPDSDLTLYAKWASTNANLRQLVLSEGTLDQSFDAQTMNYAMRVGYEVASISVTAVPAHHTSRLSINGQSVSSGKPSREIQLLAGEQNEITIAVKAQDGSTKTYTIYVTRLVPERGVTPEREGDTVHVDLKDVTILDEGGVLVVELNDALADVRNVRFSQEHMQYLKEQDATIFIQKEDVALNIPAENFNGTQELTLTLERLAKDPEVIPISNLSIGAVYQFTLRQGDQIVSIFDYDIELIFPVDDLAHENPQELRVYYWNEESEEWELIGGTYADGYIRVMTSHFSTFAVFHPSDFAVKEDKDTHGEKAESGDDDSETRNEISNSKGTSSDTSDKTQHIQESVKTDQKESVARGREGASLPNTASNVYQLITIGILLLTGGIVLFLRHQALRKR